MEGNPVRGAARQVLTGTLVGLQRIPPGLWGVGVVLDHGGLLLLGPDSLPHDLTWVAAHKGRHFSVAITQLPGDAFPVIDLAFLEGMISREARDVGLVERMMGFALRKVAKDRYRIVAPEGHPFLESHGEGPHFVSLDNMQKVAADIRRQMPS